MDLKDFLESLVEEMEFKHAVGDFNMYDLKEFIHRYVNKHLI